MVSFFSKNDDMPPEYGNRDSERQRRLENYRLAWEAYNAELPDPLVIDGPANDNVKTNPVRAMINTSVYFLFGQEVKFEMSPDLVDTTGVQATDQEGTIAPSTPDFLRSLNKAWKANRKQSFLNRLGLSGAIHGNPFIKFVPNSAGLNNEFPRMIILDPANVDVDWDPNDCERIVKYSISYITEDEQGHPVLQIQEITPNDDENDITLSWTMQDYRQPMAWDSGTGWWPGTADPLPVGPPVEWPYAWAPIEHCQNMEIPNQVWGMPDVDETSVEVVQSLQRAMSSVNKIVRIHGAPRMFAKGVLPEQVGEIDVSSDNIITLPPGPDSDLRVLEMLSNLGSSIEFTDKLREDLYEMLQVPPIALGKVSTASMNMSGASLSILYAPILQKTDLKRIPYGDMLERINYKLLILMGADTAQADAISVVWPEAMPGSKYLERQTLQQDVQMGVSMYTAAQRLGYDPKLEAQRRIEEKTAEIKAIAEASPMAQVQDKFSSNGDMMTVREGGQAPAAAAPSKPAGHGGSRNQNGSAGATGNSTPKNSKNDSK